MENESDHTALGGQLVNDMTNEKLILSAFADEAGATLAEQIAALGENNIPYIELRGVNGKNISDHTPQEAAAVAEELKANGISVYSIGSPIGKVKLHQPFEKELARFENTLAIAKATGAKCIRLFSFFEWDSLGEAAEEEVIRRLSAFCTLAKDSGITLCHENEKGIFGDTAERCRTLLDRVPDLAAVFDPANFIQCGVATLPAWEMLKDRVHYLHIKDALRDGKVVPAGCGEGNLKTIVSDFISRGGKVATLEPHLHAFTGLSSLSGEDADRILNNRRFATNREAFDFAVKAFRELIDTI